MRHHSVLYRKPKAARSGAYVVILAVMLPIMVAMAVFVTDYGIILVSKQQLQNAADAGALAGAKALAHQAAEARNIAASTSQANLVFGQNAMPQLEQDIHYGTWNPERKSFTVLGSHTQSPNAVRVKLQRSDARGNALSLFLAPALNVATANVYAEAIASFGGGCSGFVGLEGVTILNNAYTDAYDSTQGAYGSANSQPRGHVCTNGSVYMASGADIYGDAKHGSAGNFTIAAGSGATISGTHSALSRPIVKEPVDFSSAAATNDNASIPRGPAWAPPFFTPAGDLVIDNGRSVTLTDGTYYFRNVFLAGGSALTISGDVKFYVTGELRFDNGTYANLTQVPNHFHLNVGVGPVNIQGGHQLHAVIYAPQATVTVANGSGFFGTIVGRTLTLDGGIGAHYDESLRESDATTATVQLVR